MTRAHRHGVTQAHRRRRSPAGPERGAAALEAMVVLGLVVVPMLLALVTAARWVEHRAAATAIADEVARALALDPEGGDEVVALVVAAVEAGHGFEAGTLWVRSISVGEPGDPVRVEVVAALPPLETPFGSWGGAEIVVEGAERRPDHGATS